MIFAPRVRLIQIFTLCLLATSPSVWSDHLGDAVEETVKSNRDASKSQVRIDNLSDKTRQMLDEYRLLSQELETLDTYNNQLKKLLRSQHDEQQSLLQQLQEIEITQREIVPLMLNMLDSLDAFVSLDIPFLVDERTQRINRLHKMMGQADVTRSEKYRRILEAYQIENEYGRTIEAYRADLEQKGRQYTVDFLRLGRLTLYYQTLDGKTTGVWSRKTKNWQLLPDHYNRAISNGLRIARKQIAPDLLKLPVPAPEANK